MGKKNICCKQVNINQKFNLELEINKMKRIKERLRKMPDNKEKYLILKEYKNYYSLLANFYEKDKFPFEPFDFEWLTIWNKYGIENSYFAYQLGLNLEIINRLFSEAEEINWQYGIWREYNIRNKIDPKIGMLMLEEFFNEMPQNIINVYKDVMNGNIVKSIDNEEQSYVYDVSYCDKSKIMIGSEFNDYDAYWSIAHEIGHCYHFQIMNGYVKMNTLDREVPSIFMEIIFNQFVDKYLYNREYGITSLFNGQSLFANYLASENILISNSCDFDITNDTITGKMDVSKFTEKDKWFLDKIGIDMQELIGDQFVKKIEQIVPFKYTVSNLIAIYFADIYEQDKKEGLRMLKDYIMLPPSVSLQERLEMYEITGDSYKKMIKKVHDYGKRNHLL